jgi:hypothetical protein
MKLMKSLAVSELAEEVVAVVLEPVPVVDVLTGV